MSSDLLFLPAVVAKTGIGGLTLGGGVGWLIRKYGMTIDNLLSCQIVTSEGSILTASASEHQDLFWALRGGGGNFGVVTSFEFQGRPVHTVLGGLLIYPRSVAIDVITHFRDFMETAPDELTTYVALLSGPDGSPVVSVIPCYCGDLQKGYECFSPCASSALHWSMPFSLRRFLLCKHSCLRRSPTGIRTTGNQPCRGVCPTTPFAPS